MGSSVRISVALLGLGLLSLGMWRLGCWPGLPGSEMARELQRGQTLNVRWALHLQRGAVQDRIVQHLLEGQLSLRTAVRELLALQEQPTRYVPPEVVRCAGKTPELRLAFHLVESMADESVLSLPNPAEVQSRLQRELQEMQQGGR